MATVTPGLPHGHAAAQLCGVVLLSTIFSACQLFVQSLHQRGYAGLTYSS